MNFIEFESPRKLRGGFYTEADMTDFLTRWVAARGPRRALEPSCGDGAFLAALRRARPPGLRSVFACEINPEEAAKARARAGFGKQVAVEVRAEDFLQWYLTHGKAAEPFDCVLGNPPFIRYQFLPEGQQLLAERIFQGFGLPFTKHTNCWVPFVMASLALLRPGGRLGMVIPSEIFHIAHAQSLRRYLAEQCARILIVDPEEIWFRDTLQGTVLLLAEKKLHPAEPGQGVGVVPVAGRQVLQADPEELFQGATYANGDTIEGKWMRVFLTVSERRLLGELQQQRRVRR
ncbi:MAG TPA: N-6 DNA methylase, partial [Bacillota bacterium]|nr:N-6 DNA methylase [Bacillota bacterium]